MTNYNLLLSISSLTLILSVVLSILLAYVLIKIVTGILTLPEGEGIYLEIEGRVYILLAFVIILIFYLAMMLTSKNLIDKNKGKYDKDKINILKILWLVSIGLPFFIIIICIIYYIFFLPKPSNSRYRAIK